MFRLLNLALALAASANIVLTPSRLLSALFVSDEAARTLDPFVNFLVETGINLLLPAAVFLVGFCAAGLHKKAHTDMPPPPFALTTAWILYCGLWSFPHILSSNDALALGYLFAFGGWTIVLIAGVSYICWVVVSIARELSYFKHAAVAPNGVGVQFAHIAYTALTLILVTIAILWFSPGRPIYASAVDKSSYDGLCRDVGVSLLDKPPAPVRSIAYDYDPKRISGWSDVSRVELEKNGRILGMGGFSKRDSIEATKNAVFEFTERRAGDGAGAATINPSAPYYRFPAAQQPYYGVGELSADVQAFLDVDKPDEHRKAPVVQKAIRYQITLTDRRSGSVLGVQVFVVDRLNHRACGSNVDNVISPSAFIFDAINR
jgi:hypothetical protein